MSYQQASQLSLINISVYEDKIPSFKKAIKGKVEEELLGGDFDVFGGFLKQIDTDKYKGKIYNCLLATERTPDDASQAVFATKRYFRWRECYGLDIKLDDYWQEGDKGLNHFMNQLHAHKDLDTKFVMYGNYTSN